MVTFSDDFNRVDAANLGSNWVSSTTPPTIVSGRVVAPASQHVNRWSVDASTETMFSEATYLGGTGVGVAVAMISYASGSAANSAAVGTYYFFRSALTNTESNIRQKDAGSTGTTFLGADNGPTLVVNDVIRLEYDGITLTAKVNGIVVLTATPSSPIIGQKGVGFHHHAATQAGVAIVDNWSGGDVSTVSDPNAAILLESGIPLLMESGAPP